MSHLDPPEDHPGYDWNQGHHNGSEAPKSHKGTEVLGCTCPDCEDTRAYLRVCMIAMAEHGAEAVVVRCDHCQRWIDERDPGNGRLGRDFVCEDCYRAHPAVCRERMHALRGDEARDDFNETRR